jgi:hypothetical protein
MKQTPAAIIILAGAIFSAGATICFATDMGEFGRQLGTWVSVGAMICILSGLYFLIRACLLDHEMAIDVRARLDFLEELVHLEKLSMEHRRRRAELRGESLPSRISDDTNFERFTSRVG